MSYKHKTWRKKLADDKGLTKIIKITGRLSKRWGTGTLALPAPREVDALIRKIRKGRTATINDLRTAAAEDEAAGRKRITPCWRVLKEGGKLNPKFPGGEKEQARRLHAEGHAIDQRENLFLSRWSAAQI